jgi:predicted lipid-binding transport protein (Tim44 family)
VTWRRLLRYALIAGAVIVFVIAAGQIADARPGGGHTFSGGGGSSYSGGGGSSSDDGGLIYLLIWLCIEHPYLGFPLLIIVIIGYVASHRNKSQLKDWDSAAGVYRAPRPPPANFKALRQRDPEFSIVLFEDFVFRLYAQAQQARAKPGEMAALAPYLHPRVRDALMAREPAGQEISNVVVGEMRVDEVDIPLQPTDADGSPTWITVELKITSNFTATDENGRSTTYYMVDDWKLARAYDVVSKPPDPTRRFPCPNCGAPFQSSDQQTCEYCGEVVANGRFDWIVSWTNMLGLTAVPPALTGTVAERGTYERTIRAPDIDEAFAQLSTEDPGVTLDSLAARLSMIYDQLNQAWTERELESARPYVSDGLFDYLQYWIDAYKRQGLRNVLEEMTITQWTTAKLTRDKYFDALTVRIWGSGRDYTVNDDGKVVGGTKNRVREYSEYWTLIRSSTARGTPSTDKQCPNCGAPMAISMAGNCTHCDVHVTAGEFDWVLSKIEQDDVYRG